MASRQFQPPTVPGAPKGDWAKKLDVAELACIKNLANLREKALQYLEANDPTSDPGLQLVASRIAQWLPKDEQRGELGVAESFRKIALEFDDINHRDVMQKIIKEDAAVSAEEIRSVLRPSDEAERAFEERLYDFTATRNGQQVSLSQPLVIAPQPGASSVIIQYTRRGRAPRATEPVVAPAAAPRADAAVQAPTSSVTVRNPAADASPIPASSSAGLRPKTPTSRRGQPQGADAENPDLPLPVQPVQKATPEKRRKPVSRLSKAQPAPALDLTESSAPSPPTAGEAADEPKAAAGTKATAKSRAAAKAKATKSKVVAKPAATAGPSKAAAPSKAPASPNAAAGPSKSRANKRKHDEEPEQPAAKEDARPTKTRKAFKAPKAAAEPVRRSTREKTQVVRK
ncbi:hypothetical protein HDZ31DRAFT_66877 [Schizophyllum fasciatum]